MFTGAFRRVSVSDLLHASGSNTHGYNRDVPRPLHDENEDTLEQAPSLKRVYKLTDLVYLGNINSINTINTINTFYFICMFLFRYL